MSQAHGKRTGRKPINHVPGVIEVPQHARNRGEHRKGAEGRRISAEMREQDGYAARRAAADAEQAPIVRELVRGWQAEARSAIP